MKLTPFWTDSFPRPSDLPVESELPSDVDVAIIGSGYTGLSAARTLAKSGASVAVLERETIGYGASSRNGGMTTPGLKQEIAVVFKRYGSDFGRKFWQSTLDAVELAEQIITESGSDCDWQRNGYLALANKPSHFERMKARGEWMQRTLNYTSRTLGPSELGAEIGSSVFHGGLVSDFGAGVQPAKYVFGLARVAAKHGATLCEHAGVTRIEKQAFVYTVHTPRGALQAKEVLVATNGYTDMLMPKLRPKLFPVGSYIIVTEPLSEELQQALSPTGRMFYDSKNFLNYFRLTSDGRMLWGGRNNLSINLDLTESAQILHAQLLHTFPQLKGIPITHSWNGQLGITFDLMPHIGRVNGVHYALGYGGHGLSMATYLGQEAGQLIAGEKTSSPYAEIAHQTYFFYRNRTWFLPLAAQYYRILDWLS